MTRDDLHFVAGNEPMIWAVSTIKDSARNLEDFVERNLAGGVNHLVVFVDDDDPELLGHLENHPQTIGVPARDWWGNGRPEALNSRQRIAANAVRSIAAELGDVGWIFHIDGDETVQLDRRRLGQLRDDVRAVRLEVLESVAEWEPNTEHRNLFKRQLTKRELGMLVKRGVIERPRNDHYFHGHVGGKVGVRPHHNVWLGIHRAMDSRRKAIDTFEAPWLRMLHHESVSGPDFVRKWRNLLGSGTQASIRSTRAPIADAFEAEFTANGSGDPEALRQVFEQTTADDVALLQRLGFLEEIDPLQQRQSPMAYPRSELMRSQVLGLASVNKRVFEPEADPHDLRGALAPVAT